MFMSTQHAIDSERPAQRRPAPWRGRRIDDDDSPLLWRLAAAAALAVVALAAAGSLLA
jgi:anti-sigma-K factor RskA